MKKLLATAGVLGLALVSMLPAIASAKLGANRNSTLLRASRLLVAAVALGLAVTSMLPALAKAGENLNRNQTRLPN